MELGMRNAQILRGLIYPIQFDPEPIQGIECVLEMVVFAEHLKLHVSDVIAAIDAGLTSESTLSELIPQRHSEEVIRGFLAALRVRLESEPKMS